MFECLLGDFSTELVNLPLESIDATVEASMKSLVEFFDADRCHLGALSEDQSKITASYFYKRPDLPPLSVPLLYIVSPPQALAICMGIVTSGTGGEKFNELCGLILL